MERPNPLPGNRPFEDLMAYVRMGYTSKYEVIASVKVNGKEITDQDRATLAKVALAGIESVEIATVTPHELVEDTLQTLLAFTERLIGLSRGIIPADRGSRTGFLKLIDGLQTFSEGVTGVKTLLAIDKIEKIDSLETELLRPLRDLLTASQGGKNDVLADILQQASGELLNSGVPRRFPP